MPPTTKLPNAKIYVQSILLPTAAATQEKPGLSPERITRVNARLQSLAAQKGCYYLNLNESLCPDGVLQDGYAANDGLHLSKDGYIAWLEYLITHAAYDPANPYELRLPVKLTIFSPAKISVFFH